MDNAFIIKPRKCYKEIDKLVFSLIASRCSVGLLNISLPWQIHTQEEAAIISWRECSKKHALSLSEGSVQQGRSHFDARSVHGVREHGKMARTPLAAFLNIPSV